jgi:hypothetical protein
MTLKSVCLREGQRLAGNRLEINLNAHRGQLRVEVLDSNAAPIQGFAGKEAKTIDDLRFAPSWDRPLQSARQSDSLKIPPAQCLHQFISNCVP